MLNEDERWRRGATVACTTTALRDGHDWQASNAKGCAGAAKKQHMRAVVAQHGGQQSSGVCGWETPVDIVA